MRVVEHWRHNGVAGSSSYLRAVHWGVTQPSLSAIRRWWRQQPRQPLAHTRRFVLRTFLRPRLLSAFRFERGDDGDPTQRVFGHSEGGRESTLFEEEADNARRHRPPRHHPAVSKLLGVPYHSHG